MNIVKTDTNPEILDDFISPFFTFDDIYNENKNVCMQMPIDDLCSVRFDSESPNLSTKSVNGSEDCWCVWCYSWFM